MKFSKLLKYDLKNGFLLGSIKWLVLVLLVIAFCLDFYLRKSHTYIFEESIPAGTMIDYLFYIFAGMREYIPSMTESFIFPVKWLLLHLFIFYCTLYYPYRDLSSLGLNILVRTKGRIAWWISKSIWNICYVLAMYAVIFLTVLLFCLVMQEPITLDITPVFVHDLLDAGSPFDTFSTKLVYTILFFPLLMSIGLNLVQMTLVLFIKPLYSFGLMAVLLLASAYLLTPYLPGNYAMPIRSAYVVENGMSTYGGILMFLLLVSASFIVGCLYFRRYDILVEE
ncbi:hypothetical protein MUB24_00135 [Lederbergia sp. NSJ-179]|uniref:hypothetical protein n=1 Tax=Lederbergia sp. NSJ-179 TaxID=2931402 RepID=UPI001FD31587|nr:hypothetical protein [Lederbergia sp. NSJ-179]MCJ7839335.1 hypothetical protein [Lederbergia sp. NSJ-179]